MQCAFYNNNNDNNKNDNNNNNNNNNEPDSAYRDTQQYLENRFPPVSTSTPQSRPKSVTFSVNDFDANRKEQKRRHSENRPPNVYEERNENDFDASLNEPLYENASETRTRAREHSITEDPNKIYSHMFQKQPPPLPPRAPTTRLSDGFRLNHVTYNTTTVNTTSRFEEHFISDRQLGSETDSGIDVNETAGRMFALSVNDREPSEYREPNEHSSHGGGDVYSKPIGFHYSDQRRPMAGRQQHTRDDTGVPNSFAVAKNPYNDQKYKSWNGRTFHEAQRVQHRDDDVTRNNFYEPRRDNCGGGTMGRESKGRNTNGNRKTRSMDGNNNNNNQYCTVRKVSGAVDFSLYDFDNQPEIML